MSKAHELDVFRKNYGTLSEKQKLEMDHIKTKAEELWDEIDNATTPSNARLMAMAKTELEFAVMAAVKGVTTQEKPTV